MRVREIWRVAWKLAAVGLLATYMAPGALGQSPNEVGLVMGATLTPAPSFTTGSVSSISFDPSLAFGAEYDRRIAAGGIVTLYLGVDLLASPYDVIVSDPAPDVISQYAYLFVTPHVRVKFGAAERFAPWVMIGGGYARFLEREPEEADAFTAGKNTGTLVYGAGIDTPAVIEVLGLPIGFRVEARDFYSAVPQYSQTTTSDMQHNVSLAGGLLVRF